MKPVEKLKCAQKGVLHDIFGVMVVVDQPVR